jgi:diacylglycerol O-acyltransferase-1
MTSKTEAVTTALDHSSSPVKPNGVTSNKEQPSTHLPEARRRSKYRHVAAYHSRTRHSSLSRESNVTTSFLGFRNLMVLVLGIIDPLGKLWRYSGTNI